jgi:hypothetical protein
MFRLLNHRVPYRFDQDRYPTEPGQAWAVRARPRLGVGVHEILNDPAHHASLVLQRGWSEDSFRSWLAATMKHSLLPSQYN